ncbi:tetratricopeptide repeat protein [Nonomuraea helvata]|uniref:Tetratricopeptide repeat protein n=1 Tax=Nonomuraea helvata TaxID=37484 RepID=A0ABV5S9T9_9ACTN
MPFASDALHVDCHAHRIYPYVGCNALMNLLLPRIRRECPDLIRQFARSIVTLAPDSHAIVLEAAPDLAPIIGEPGEIPFTADGRDEGLHHRTRTTWLAHAMVEFLRLCWRDGERVVFINVDHADPLQREFLDILIRRIRPDQARIVLQGHGPSPGPDVVSPDAHAERAVELLRLGRRSLELTLVPYHFERSSAEPGRIVEALSEAARYYSVVGFYEIAMRLARAALLHSPRDGLVEGRMHRVVITSLMMLGRLREAEALCVELQQRNTNPVTLLNCANVRALMHARLHSPQERDYEIGARQLEECLRHLRDVPECLDPVANTIFVDTNLRALLELRAGRPDKSMRLLRAGLRDLKRDCPDLYSSEAALYFQNVGRLHYRARRYALAAEAFSEALEHEPLSPESYFERGNSWRAAGDHVQAVRDYELAVVAGPAYPQIHFNAALSYASMSRDEEAVAEYGKALELDPAYVDALLNRANLHYARGRFLEAGQDVRRGLALSPGHPGLLCTLGLLELRDRDHRAALAAFTAALAARPAMTEALINRASTWFDLGHAEQAIKDLTRALSIRPDATAYFNRGLIHQFMGRWQEAIDDYDRALLYENADTAAVTRRRDDCARTLADVPETGAHVREAS